LFRELRQRLENLNVLFLPGIVERKQLTVFLAENGQKPSVAVDARGI